MRLRVGVYFRRLFIQARSPGDQIFPDFRQPDGRFFTVKRDRFAAHDRGGRDRPAKGIFSGAGRRGTDRMRRRFDRIFNASPGKRAAVGRRGKFAGNRAGEENIFFIARAHRRFVDVYRG